MAGVSVDSKGGKGRKTVDTAINMVPMIDLLISVIAFLLMTVVWVRIGALHSEQPHGPDNTHTAMVDNLKVEISASGFRVGTTQVDMHDVARSPDQFDALRTVLASWHHDNRATRDVQIQPDSTVHYDEIIRVMDVIYDVWSEGRPPREPIGASVRVQLL